MMGLEIDPDEFSVTFIRSAGPGGQNVNKLSTRAVVRFSVLDSRSLTAEQRERITRRLAHRLTRTGELRVTCQRHRSQAANRREAVRRLLELLEAAATPPRPRRRTRPPAAARARRLEGKRRRATLKQSRHRPRSSDDG